MLCVNPYIIADCFGVYCSETLCLYINTDGIGNTGPF